MATAQLAPPVFRGALATVSALNPLGTVVVFQYNPASLTRTLAAKMTGGEGGGSGSPRFAGPPDETIKFTVELDATDQLEAGDSTTESLGLLPALAALEAMLYPPSPVIVANEVLARVGIVEILPMAAPLILLVWGTRILPVSITDFSVTEDAFDLALNPVLAKVDLGLKVLSYYELGLLSPGGALSLAHHIATEALGLVGASGTLPNLIGNVAGIGG